MATAIAQNDHSGCLYLDEGNEQIPSEDEIVKSSSLPQGPAIDVENHRYPYCIVWTPLPVITAIVPNIGHTGICTYQLYRLFLNMNSSEGVIHDFAASHYISVRHRILLEKNLHE